MNEESTYKYVILFSDGIIPPSIDTGPVELNSVIGSLQTGDLVLFSGVTPSGAIIRFFDKSQFSHVGIVSISQYISESESMRVACFTRL